MRKLTTLAAVAFVLAAGAVTVLAINTQPALAGGCSSSSCGWKPISHHRRAGVPSGSRHGSSDAGRSSPVRQ
jgi:hypothetical protein